MINEYINEENSKISTSRYKQIKQIVKDSHTPINKNSDKDEKAELWAENREYSRAEVADILEDPNNRINKTESKKLTIFLKNFIAGLSHEKYNHLHKMLNSYLEFSSIKYPMLEDDFNYIQSFDAPIFDVLYKLISEKVLLPETKNQAEFNKELESILYRQLSKIEIEAKKLPFFIAPINTGKMISYMLDGGMYEIVDEVEIDGGANRFAYKIELRDINSVKEFPKGDDITYKLSFGKIGGVGIDRDEIMDYITNEYTNISKDIFSLTGTRDLNLNFEVRPRIIDDGLSGIIEDQRESFDIEFFLYPKKKMDSFEYFDKASSLLNDEVPKFMSRFYNIFQAYPETTNFLNIDAEVVFDKLGIDTGKGSKTLAAVSKGGSAVQDSKNAKDSKETSKLNISDDIISTIDEMILEESEKRELKKIVNMFNFPEHFAAYGLELPKGMILAGPPGVGKTTFLKLLAKLTNSEFIHISHTDITSKWEGESEKNIKAKFDQARKLVAQGKKVIMAFDEGDSLFEARGEERNNKEGIISVILAELDGFDAESSKNIFVTILTNRPEAVDPALKERLNKKVTLSLPTKSQRVEHLKLNIDYIKRKSKKEIFAGDIDLEKIASKIDKKSGRFIKNLIINAADDFANKTLDSDVSLISTDDIISAIKYTDEQEKEENKAKVMGFRNDK